MKHNQRQKAIYSLLLLFALGILFNTQPVNAAGSLTFGKGKDTNCIKDPEGTCVDKCEAPLKLTTKNGARKCETDCPAGSFTYPDGSCCPTCPAPFKQSQVGCMKICLNPCKFVNWENKCCNSCDSPFKKRTEKGIDYCDKPCEDKKYFWEQGDDCQECLDTCLEGWECAKDKNGLDICKQKCPNANQIWSPKQGKCCTSCPVGYDKETINKVPMCAEKCECGEYFWETGCDGGACVKVCPDGFECGKDATGLDICKPKCTGKDDTWFKEDGKCVCDCPAGWKKEKVNGINVCNAACQKGEFFWEECEGKTACLCECLEGWVPGKGCAGVDICVPKCTGKDNIFFKEGKKCVCDCPKGWQVDLINNLPACNPVCDKGQYFWAQGGKDGACVDKCPEGWECGKDDCGLDICKPKCCGSDNIWFKEVGKCVCDCPAGWKKEKINEVEFCTQVCCKGEFFWEKCDDEGACVCECPDGLTCAQGFGGVDLCVPKCTGKDNIWFKDAGKCVCECPKGFSVDIVNGQKTCNPTCDCNQYFWAEGGKDGACVDKCPEGWVCGKSDCGLDICQPKCCGKENIWLEEEGKCVCDCPVGFSVQKINKVDVCAPICDKGEFFWEGCDGKGSCVCACPDGWVCGKGCYDLDICVPKCTGKDYIWFKDAGKCVCECPKGFSVDIVNGQPSCNPVCDKNQYFWAEGGKDGACVDKCPEGWVCGKSDCGLDICQPICCGKENVWFEEAGKCVCDCPAGFNVEKINKVDVCSPICGKGEFFWEGCDGKGSCVCACPDGWVCGKDCYGLDICVPKCTGKDYIWFKDAGKCVCECPKGWNVDVVNGQPTCNPTCDKNQYFWAQGGKDGACVDKCPEGLECAKDECGLDICKPKCCGSDNIWFKEVGKCVCDCPAGWKKEKINEVDFCTKVCPKGEFFWEKCDDEGACLCECPDGLTCSQGFGGVDLCVPKCTGKDNIWFKDIGKCVCECPSGFLVDIVNGQKTCNPVCDCDQYFWAQGGKDGACVDKCPAGWQCAKDSYKRDICVPACTGKEDTWINGKCVCDCPAGFNKEKVNHVDFCTPTCDKGEYFWAEGGKNGACVCVCPEGWECGKDRNGLDICKPKCDEGIKKIWFPDQNQCVKECPCGWEKEKVNKVDFCRRECRAGQVYWAEGGNDGLCVDKCPEGWQCGKDKYVCEPICDSKGKDKFWCPFTKKCLSDCAKGFRPWLLNKLPYCEKCDD